MAQTTSTTKNGVTTTTTTPDKPKPVKGKTDTNGDGKVNALDDINNDGVANNKDKTLRQDNLSMQMLGQDYATAARIVGSDPSLKKVFSDAVAGGWSKEQFAAALRNTTWYNEQGTEYARMAWMSKANGGKQWEDELSLAKDMVQRQAATMGAELSESELDAMAEQYIFKGWGKDNRQGLMIDALASTVNAKKGGAAKTRDDLLQMASDNGVGLTDKWITDVTRSIARGESTQQDYETWIREQAAMRYPMYADKIKAGVSVKALASPYLQRMSDILEIPAEQVSLNDKYISEALGQVNEKGDQVAMSYTDFENKLRQDPRWETTKNGKNTLMDMASNFMKQMGFAN